MTPDEPDAYDAALLAALKLLRTSDRTEAEVRRRLERSGTTPETIEAVLAYLRRRRFVDDERIVEREVQRAQGARPIGKERLRWELERRGAEPEAVERALADLSEEGEVAKAVALLKAKFGADAPLDKAARFLSRKGFDEEVVRRALELHFGPIA